MGFKEKFKQIESEVNDQNNIDTLVYFSSKVTMITEKISAMSTSKLVISKDDLEDLCHFKQRISKIKSDSEYVNERKQSLSESIEKLLLSIEKAEFVEDLLTKEELVEIAVLAAEIIGILQSVIDNDNDLQHNSLVGEFVEIPIDLIENDENKFNALKYKLLQHGIAISDECSEISERNNEKFGYHIFVFRVSEQLKMSGIQRKIVKPE